MIITLCIDTLGGMMFNHRRQSRDSRVINDVTALAHGKKILTAHYSAALFSGAEAEAREDFLDAAGEGDICFVEDRHIAPYADKAEKIIIYNWNRRYPSDFKLDISPAELGFTLIETSEFSGSSHERITREVYAK